MNETIKEKLKSSLNFKAMALFNIAFLVLLKPEISASLRYLGLASISMKADLAILGVIALVIFAFLVKSLIKSKKVDWFLIFFLVYVGFIGLASFMNPGNGFLGMFSRNHDLFMPAYYGWIIDWTPIASTVFLVAAFGRKYGRELIWAMALVASFYMLVNFWAVIMRSIETNFGFYDDAFLYHRNLLFRIFIPAIACSAWIAWRYKKGWVCWPVIVFAASFVQVYLSYSATCACILAVMGTLGLVMTFKKPRFVCNGLVFVCTYIGAFFAFVIFRVQMLFGFAIEAILHKTATFTGRTLVWDEALNALQGSHLLLGYGPVYMWNMLHDEYQNVRHAHNEVLNTLMLGGLCALAGLIGCAALAVSSLFKYRYSNAAAAFALGLAGYLTAGVAEPVTYPGFFFMLAVGYYIVPALAAIDKEYE